MTTRQEQRQQYQAFIRRKRVALVVAALASVAAALVALGYGSMKIPLADVVDVLVGGGEAKFHTAIFGIRLPRVLAAVLVGAVLATAGAVMQCVLQNPLASASTLGVSQGAAFGAAVGLVVFEGGALGASTATASTSITIQNPYTVTICAFVFGSVSTAVVLLISRFRPDIGPAGLILAGVALSSLFGGGLTLLQYFADDTKLGAIVFWTFGNLGSAQWSDLAILTAVFVGAFVYFMLNRWNYNALEAGGDVASSLGVPTRRVVLTSLVICSLSSAVAVSFVGIIGFVGLIAPHIMRRFVGNDYRYLLPASALMGALLLLAADLFARWAIAPVILPIGAITSFLGAPLFLFLLLRGFKTDV